MRRVFALMLCLVAIYISYPSLSLHFTDNISNIHCKVIQYIWNQDSMQVGQHFALFGHVAVYTPSVLQTSPPQHPPPPIHTHTHDLKYACQGNNISLLFYWNYTNSLPKPKLRTTFKIRNRPNVFSSHSGHNVGICVLGTVSLLNFWSIYIFCICKCMYMCLIIEAVGVIPPNIQRTTRRSSRWNLLIGTFLRSTRMVAETPNNCIVNRPSGVSHVKYGAEGSKESGISTRLSPSGRPTP